MDVQIIKIYCIRREGRLRPPVENETVTRRVILSLSNPKGAAGGISSAHKTNSAERKISLYVKFVGLPVWLAVIGFPHPPSSIVPLPPREGCRIPKFYGRAYTLGFFLEYNSRMGAAARRGKADGYRSNFVFFALITRA